MVGRIVRTLLPFVRQELLERLGKEPGRRVLNPCVRLLAWRFAVPVFVRRRKTVLVAFGRWRIDRLASRCRRLHVDDTCTVADVAEHLTYQPHLHALVKEVT